jgi:hypothetical protein
LLAGYIAQYMAFQFPRQDWAENLVSTVANDLLETMVKIASDRSTIALHCFQEEDEILLDANLVIQPQAMGPFQDFAAIFSRQDIHEMSSDLSGEPGDAGMPLKQFGLVLRMQDLLEKVPAKVDRETGIARIQVCLSTKELVI